MIQAEGEKKEMRVLLSMMKNNSIFRKRNSYRLRQKGELPNEPSLSLDLYYSFLNKSIC